MEIRVQVQGLDQLVSKLHGDTLYTEPVRTFFKGAAKTVWSEVFQRTPRRLGNLQQHLYAEVDPSPLPKYARVGFQPLKYAPYVEYGTGIYGEGPGASRQPIVPTTKKALAFSVGGKRIVRRSVKGMQPRRMLRDGWAAALPKVEALLKRAAHQVTELWQGQR